MQTRHRQLQKTVVLGLVVLVIALPIWPLYRQIRQERLDQALIAAIRRNDARTVAALLSQGAAANAVAYPTEERPFWTAFMDRLRGKTPTLGECALMTAFEAWWNPEGGSDEPPENTAIIHLLLDRNADVNCRGEMKVTPLIEAALSRRPALVQRLIDKGAELNAKDDYERTALSYVGSTGMQHPYYPEIERILKRAGAEEE